MSVNTEELRRRLEAAGRGDVVNWITICRDALTALDAQAATIKAQEGEIERLRAENARVEEAYDEKQRCLMDTLARINTGNYPIDAVTHAEIARQLAKLTAENTALRQRCAAAEADMVLAVGGRRCVVCANDQCHYSDDEDIVACSASMFKWRGPQPAADELPEPPAGEGAGE